jgi:hypothetical protein
MRTIDQTFMEMCQSIGWEERHVQSIIRVYKIDVEDGALRSTTDIGGLPTSSRLVINVHNSNWSMATSLQLL